MAYMYGRNIGLAFQLIDDWLDFVSSADQLGKGSRKKVILFNGSAITALTPHPP